MTNINVLLQLFEQLTDRQKQQFLRSLSKESSTTLSVTIESKEQYLQTIRYRKIQKCPHCKGTHIVKNGHSKEGQRYLCRNCNRTFCIATKSLTAYSKYDIKVWRKYIHCMMNKLSLRASARECGISVKTAFDWRHKILDALQKMAKQVKLDGIVEADETFFRLSFKGNHMKTGFNPNFPLGFDNNFSRIE